MEKVSFKGVALGVMTDIGGTLLASVLLLSYFAGDALSPEMAPEQAERVMRRLLEDGGYLLANLVIGLVFTGLGGYVAARVARRELYLNAGLVGVVSLLLGVFFGGQGPFWFEVAGIVLIVPAALYGAYLADRQLAG